VISFRYHVVSLTVVFLALAVGVVLGSTALSDRLLSGVSGDRSALRQEVTSLQEGNNALRMQLADAERFAVSMGPTIVRGALDQRSVVLITVDGADPADREAVIELLREAGATLTGEVQLTDTFTDPAHADQLRELVTRLLPAGVQLPTETDPGTLAGGLIGPLVLVDRETGQPRASAEEVTAALRGLSEGGFVRVGEGLQPAQLVVILTGGAYAGDEAADRAATVARFAVQVERAGAGGVLAGRAGSADGTGAVGVVRADSAATSTLSTVDNVHTTAGRVVTVLALRDEVDGRSGKYGTAGNAQAPAPEPAG